MNVEIELKMRLVDRAALEHRLRQRGASRRSSVLETNIYFDTQDLHLKAGDRGLRLRRTCCDDGSSQSWLTYKGPRAHGPFKSRQEEELRLDDADAAERMLRGLGYIAALTFEKKRDTWLLNDCLVELDELPLLGRFVEIEGPDEKAVAAVRSKLELDDEPVEPESYIGLLMNHLQEQGIAERVIVFDAAP
ncbi:MAG: class IV adenylate cyclase [Phycisphaeraceae bacterium]|nr:class IV adenylate cyclase [Phycisphaeraceae bacterium]